MTQSHSIYSGSISISSSVCNKNKILPVLLISQWDLIWVIWRLVTVWMRGACLVPLWHWLIRHPHHWSTLGHGSVQHGNLFSSQPAGRATARGCHYQLPNTMMGNLVIKNQLSNIILLINMEITIWWSCTYYCCNSDAEPMDVNLDLFCSRSLVFIT